MKNRIIIIIIIIILDQKELRAVQSELSYMCKNVADLNTRLYASTQRDVIGKKLTLFIV